MVLPVRMASSALELDVRRRALKARMFGIDEAPRHIGRYPVERLLGEGAMGVVYLARDVRLERPVAIKVLRAGLAAGEVRLEREARALARLSHPHVVTIHEVGDHQGQIFIVMEYVPGENLRRWMTRSQPMDARCEILRQAAEGLEAAHRIGLVHRDFKPENAIVGEDGRLRILDFGLATSPAEAISESSEPMQPTAPWSRVTQTGARLGTPAYMAPELLDEAIPSAATDRFAWCCVAWEVLMGEHPLEQRSGGKRSIRAGETARHRRAKRVLERGLQRDPALRPGSWPPLVDALRPRRPGALAGGLVGLALLAGAGVTWLGITPSTSTSATPAAPTAPAAAASNCSETPAFDLPRPTLESNRRVNEEDLRWIAPDTPEHDTRSVVLAGSLLALGAWAPPASASPRCSSETTPTGSASAGMPATVAQRNPYHPAPAAWAATSTAA